MRTTSEARRGGHGSGRVGSVCLLMRCHDRYQPGPSGTKCFLLKGWSYILYDHLIGQENHFHKTRITSSQSYRLVSYRIVTYHSISSCAVRYCIIFISYLIVLCRIIFSNLKSFCLISYCTVSYRIAWYQPGPLVVLLNKLFDWTCRASKSVDVHV